ncbi:hypothetical protein M5K25_024348 [Dendrobium thyrsiflorum]|uniref:Uncharacterized protein n=1 Tax=Dendrobium thyrsiflorum TaxID=117978 RepID=A0ABD0U259_DENTH
MDPSDIFDQALALCEQKFFSDSSTSANCYGGWMELTLTSLDVTYIDEIRSPGPMRVEVTLAGFGLRGGEKIRLGSSAARPDNRSRLGFWLQFGGRRGWLPGLESAVAWQVEVVESEPSQAGGTKLRGFPDIWRDSRIRRDEQRAEKLMYHGNFTPTSRRNLLQHGCTRATNQSSKLPHIRSRIPTWDWRVRSVHLGGYGLHAIRLLGMLDGPIGYLLEEFGRTHGSIRAVPGIGAPRFQHIIRLDDLPERWLKTQIESQRILISYDYLLCLKHQNIPAKPSFSLKRDLKQEEKKRRGEGRNSSSTTAGVPPDRHLTPEFCRNAT